MILNAEVTGRHDHAGDASRLLYTPLDTPHSYRATRRYTLEFDGDESRARAFVERTLTEPVSQRVVFGEQPALAGARFILDYGFKPGALDLERETLLAYYHSLADPGFSLKKLTITQRLYFFAEGTIAPPERFVRDIVNPAIHRHSILAA